MSDSNVLLSKKMSHILRHHAFDYHLAVTVDGFVGLEDLAEVITLHHFPATVESLRKVVQSDSSNRFTIFEDKIRAAQGHTFPVQLGYKEVAPPDFLYHGTVESAVDSIMRQGLLAQGRHAVHLTNDVDIALEVGSRNGTPVLLEINTEGLVFTLSSNRVWLTDSVPPHLIRVVKNPKVG